MNQHQLLAELFRRRVKVWIDDGQLRVRAPKGTLTPELRDALVAQKQAILSAVSSLNLVAPASHAPVAAVPRNGSLPLSFNQQRLWSLAQLRPDSPVYNLSKALRLTGILNISALGQSVSEIAQRHEILSTTFPAVKGQSAQIISSDMSVQMPVVDLRDLDATEQQARVQRLASVEAEQPFCLTKGPLLRARLLQLGDEKHLFFVTVHHIVFDAWSFNIFCRDLATLYAAFSTGKPSTLRALPIQYADFAHWEQQTLQPEALKLHLDFWKRQLDGEVPALELPLDRPRLQGQTSPGVRQTLVLPEKLTYALKALGQREESTLFVILLAAFQTLLHGYTGQEDIVVCSAVAGRQRPETQPLIGYFSRLLPMRTNLSGNPSFREILGRVRKVVLEVQEHQDVPLQWLADFPNLVHTPLTRGMLLLQIPSQPPELPDLIANLSDVHNGAADFDLSLTLEETEATISGVLEYKTDLFEATTISHMARYFQTLLEGIVADPEQPISEIRPPRRYERKSDSCASPVLDQTKPDADRPFMAPRDELELQLTKIWERVLMVQPIGVQDNFFALGGHSMLAVQLCERLANTTGHPLPLTRLYQLPTIAQLAAALRQQECSPHWTALVPMHASGTRPPLFIVPPAGMTVSKFTHWTRYFASEQPVYGLQPLGFDGQQVPHECVEAMAIYYLADIRKLQPTGPYMLAGICFGASVALEMGQQLHDQGEHVALLAILDPIPIAVPSIWDRASQLVHYWRQGSLLKASFGYLASRIKRRYNWFDREQRYFRHVIDAHMKAYYAYQVRPYAGDIMLIQSQESAEVGHTRTQWAALTTGTLTHVVIPETTHSEILRDPSARLLIQELTRQIPA